MTKKAQNWSVEMIIASALFVTFFVTFLTFSFAGNTNDLRETEYVSDELSSKLLSQNTELGIIDSRNAIDRDKLLELSDLSFEEIQSLFGVSEDFCILFVDDVGDIILVDGKYGIGSDEIKINGDNCNSTATLPLFPPVLPPPVLPPPVLPPPVLPPPVLPPPSPDTGILATDGVEFTLSSGTFTIIDFGGFEKEFFVDVLIGTPTTVPIYYGDVSSPDEFFNMNLGDTRLLETGWEVVFVRSALNSVTFRLDVV